MSKPINILHLILINIWVSIFEKICTEYLWERLLQNDLSFSFLDLASWWVKNPQTKKQEETDIIGTSGHTSVFGECKWKNELVDTPVLDQLILRSQMFPYVDNHYFLFSKTGFTLACQERAEQLDNVELVTLLIFLRICLKFNFAKSCLLC